MESGTHGSTNYSFTLLAADQAALENFTSTGRRPVRRAQALLALATGIGQQAAGQAMGLSRQAVSQVRCHYEAVGWQTALAEAQRFADRLAAIVDLDAFGYPCCK